MKMQSIFGYTNDLTAAYALRDVDKQLDTDTTVTWQTQISPLAVHGSDLRNVIFFDWYAGAVKGTNGLQ